MERNALEALGRLLDSLGIRWALMGALAANRYRTSARLTQDVGLLRADLGPGLDAVERALGGSGWSVLRASPRNELPRLRHPEPGG